MDFLTHFVVSDQDVANPTRLELVKRFSYAQILRETDRCGHQRLCGPSIGLLVDRHWKVVNPC
jgi:hypothetical protein